MPRTPESASPGAAKSADSEPDAENGAARFRALTRRLLTVSPAELEEAKLRWGKDGGPTAARPKTPG